MVWLRTSLLLIFFSLGIASPALADVETDTIGTGSVCPTAPECFADTVSAHPRPWLAATQIITMNVGIMSYDHIFMTRHNWAHVTMNTIKENLKPKTWQWDADYLYTNTIEHPYHGAAYYTAGRANGLGIAASSACALGGSMMWELICESEPPSFSDMVTTPIGGITLGEPLHRVSSIILDDRKRGAERVGREILAGLVNPMRAFERLVTGKAWKVNRPVPARSGQSTMFESSLSAGYRWLDTRGMPNVRSAYVRWSATYGDIMGAEGHGLFDYFDLDATMAIGGHQSPLNNASVSNVIYSWSLSEKEGRQSVAGFYNHLYHLYAEPEYEQSIISPNEYDDPKKRQCTCYAEIGSIGPGFAWRLSNSCNSSGAGFTPHFSPLTSHPSTLMWEQQIFVNGILLGATPTVYTDDAHYTLGYSFGSGYGAKMRNRLQWTDRLRVRLDADFSQLFTWRGYDCRNSNDTYRRSTKAMGEAGNVLTVIGSSTVELRPLRHLGIEWRGRYVWQHFNYSNHPHASLKSWEVQAGLQYVF